MFENSLLDSGKREPTRRGTATLLSLAIQGMFVGALVLAPMIYTDTLPGFRLQAASLTTPVEPPPPLGTPDGGGGNSAGQIELVAELPTDNVLREPARIPLDIDMSPAPPAPPLHVGPGGRPGPLGVPDGVPGGTGTRPLPVLTQPQPPARVSLPSSRLEQGMLVRRVTPLYPQVAKQTGIQGQVVLRAVIARDGTIQSLQVVSGHPFLAPAALDAVQQWRYRPYILNGVPVEVDTTVTVRFVLNR